MDFKLVKQSASELEVSEWIVFGFSITAFVLILSVVLYEVIQPLMNDETWRGLTLLEYYRRYNREEYDKLKPKEQQQSASQTQVNDTSRGPLIENKPPPVVSNVVDEMTLRKNMGNKLLGIFGKATAVDRVGPYTDIKTANNSLIMDDNSHVGPPAMNNS